MQERATGTAVARGDSVMSPAPSTDTARLPDFDACPAPWSRNPSAWRQRIPIALLAMVGFAISAYLAAYQFRFIDSVWDPIFGEGSERVLDSDVSHRMRSWILIPDAALGAFAYLGDAIYGLAGTTRRWQYRPWLVVVFGIDVIPLGAVSAILVFLQGAAVGSWCTLCIASAVVSLTLLLLAVDEVWSTCLYLWRIWRTTRSPRTLWLAFCGRPSAPAHEQAMPPHSRSAELAGSTA